MWSVTFETNLGSAIEALNVEDGTTLERPLDPTKENFTFMGWFKDAMLTLPWDFDSDTVAEDVVLYAKWRFTIAEKLRVKLAELTAGLDDKIQLFESLAEFPAEGLLNSIYIDMSTGIIYYWSGLSYERISEKNVYVQETPPEEPELDTLWFDIS